MPGLTCWNCGADTEIEKGPMRSEQCGRCLADLRSCRGCRHFDPLRHFQCREKIPLNIPIKDKANYCDFYQVRLTGAAALGRFEAKKSRKDRFDDLFED